MVTKKTYQEKLLDPKWQRKRLEILNRDNWKCRHCQKEDKTLHVHHFHYAKNLEPWDYDDDLLITLCSDCHALESKYLEACKYLLFNTLAGSGISRHDLLGLLSDSIGTNHKYTEEDFSHLCSALMTISMSRDTYIESNNTDTTMQGNLWHRIITGGNLLWQE